MKINTPKIIYVTSVRLPTEKAHGLSTVKLCEALTLCGYEVDCVIPHLWRGEKRDVFKYYNLKSNFKIFKIPCIDLSPLGHFEKFAFLIQSVSFSILSLFFVAVRYRSNMKNYIFFSHDYIPLYFMTFLPVKIFYDIHHFPGDNFMYKRVMKRSFGFAVQTKWKVLALHKKYEIPLERIVYWPNGTDVENFNIELSTSEARKKIGIPLGKKIVMYTGQLFNWKGVDTLIQSVKILPQDALVYVVGGSKTDVDNCKKEIPEASDERIVFIPFQQHSEIPIWLRASDVLILPNTGKQKVSLYYTSPMKLFEYLAAGKPIVASAIPSIMEILNDSNSVLVSPDDPAELAMGINKVFKSADFAKSIAGKASRDSKKYTWEKRAQIIINFFKNHE